MIKNFVIVSAAIFLLLTAGCGSDTATESKPPVTEENLIGRWSSIEKDSGGVVKTITILDIETEKTATLRTLNLTASKFSESEPVQIFWQVGNVQAGIKRSGKTLKITADNVELLELRYDGQKLSKDAMIFTKQNIDVESLKMESLSRYQKNIGERSEILGDMTQAEYKNYINQKIFGLR